MQDLAAHYRATALRALSRLSAGSRNPETVHRARTHLRRLQAYLELVGERANACLIADCVSRLSRLRALQVFAAYLAEQGAPAADRRTVLAEIAAVRTALARDKAYADIAALAERHALPPTPSHTDWLEGRLAVLRRQYSGPLRKQARKAARDPRRKRLHKLRLMVKAIRYQEEWAVGQGAGNPRLVHWLKRLQDRLGAYEDLCQFRRLAQKLDLRSTKLIVADRRRARARAWHIPETLLAHLDALIAGRLHRRNPSGPTTAPRAARRQPPGKGLD